MKLNHLLWLVFLVALGLTAFLMLPAVQSNCRTSPQSRAAYQLWEIGAGLIGYEFQQGRLPTLIASELPEHPIQSWATRCLPFLGHQELFDSIDLARPWDDPANGPIFQTHIGTLVRPGVDDAPLASGLAPSHYAGNVEVLGSEMALRTSQIRDGAANTILMGEAQEIPNTRKKSS